MTEQDRQELVEAHELKMQLSGKDHPLAIVWQDNGSIKVNIYEPAVGRKFNIPLVSATANTEKDALSMAIAQLEK